MNNYKYIIRADKETEDNQIILFIGDSDKGEDIIEMLFLECYNETNTINSPVVHCFEEMMNPLRLNIDFKIVPIHEGEKDGETVYISPLCHDDFKVLLTCNNKEFLFNFIDFVIHPEKPTREQILQELNKLDKELEYNKRRVLNTEVKINSLQRRFNLEGYN